MVASIKNAYFLNTSGFKSQGYGANKIKYIGENLMEKKNELPKVTSDKDIVDLVNSRNYGQSTGSTDSQPVKVKTADVATIGIDSSVDLGVDLIPNDAIRVGRGGRKGSGEKYIKYAEAVDEKKADEWIKAQIAKSGYNNIKVTVQAFAEACGFHLKENLEDDGLSATALEWGFKYVLYHRGIDVRTGRTKVGDKPVFIFSILNPKRKLPGSLRPKPEQMSKADQVTDEKPDLRKAEDGSKEVKTEPPKVDLKAAETGVSTPGVTSGTDNTVTNKTSETDNKPANEVSEADQAKDAAKVLKDADEKVE